MTRILIYHYESFVADFVNKISFLRVDPFQVQHFINKTLDLLMEGHPIKKEFQTSSFRIQQRGTFQESKSTKVQNREEVKPGI